VIQNRKVRERKLNRCDSGTDSKVWMKEDCFRLFFAPWVYTQGVFCCNGGPLMNELWTQVSENLQFIGICIVIVGVLGWLSGLVERKLQIRQVTSARRVTIIGICAAIATVLHILDFPLLFMAPEFYKLDFSELPVMLCGFYLGPSATVACEGVKILLKLLLKGTSTAFVGDFANFAVGCSLVLPATVIYHLGKSKKSAVTGLIVGTLVLTVFGSAFNAIYLLPKFSELFGLPLDTIIAMGSAIHPAVSDLTTFVALCVAPLNLVKGGAVSVLTLLLYKRVARPLFGGK